VFGWLSKPKEEAQPAATDRADQLIAEGNRAERLAVAAGLGNLNLDGRLVTPRFGRLVYVAEVIFTDLPLEPDGQEGVV